MNKRLVSLCFVTVLGGAAIAYAQNGTQDQTQIQTVPVPIQSQSQFLTNQFETCIKSPDCSVQDRIGLVKEMQVLLDEHFDVISEACARLSYKPGCVDPREGEVQQWHKVHDDMQRMMLSLEAPALAAEQPSAGETGRPAVVPKKDRWWDKIWPKAWGQ